MLYDVISIVYQNESINTVCFDALVIVNLYVYIYTVYI